MIGRRIAKPEIYIENPTPINVTSKVSSEQLLIRKGVNSLR
jgi:hypothetical protein